MERLTTTEIVESTLLQSPHILSPNSCDIESLYNGCPNWLDATDLTNSSSIIPSFELIAWVPHVSSSSCEVVVFEKDQSELSLEIDGGLRVWTDDEYMNSQERPQMVGKYSRT